MPSKALIGPAGARLASRLGGFPMSKADEPAKPEPTEIPPVVVPAEQLFRGRREIIIDCDGVQYRLRITRRKKLLLQK